MSKLIESPVAQLCLFGCGLLYGVLLVFALLGWVN